MNTETPAKRPLISLPFIIIVGSIALIGIFFGQTIMEQVMLMQESAKAKEIVVPEEYADLSAWGKALNENPNADFEGAAITPGGGGGASSGGRPDPDAMFSERDADEDGKLSGDEISGRMADRVDEIDTDGDGSISKDEFMTAIENMRAQREGSDNSDE
ncbi:MAG: EF-hand domain-containing protein [Pirellulaceae bacterium]